VIEYFRWLYNDATYMQFKLEELKWGFGFFFAVGLPVLCFWVWDQIKSRRGR
jgi:hypothetical protein